MVESPKEPMNWISNVVRPKIRSLLQRKDVPENLWIKCPETGQLDRRRLDPAHDERAELHPGDDGREGERGQHRRKGEQHERMRIPRGAAIAGGGGKKKGN